MDIHVIADNQTAKQITNWSAYTVDGHVKVADIKLENGQFIVDNFVAHATLPEARDAIQATVNARRN